MLAEREYTRGIKIVRSLVPAVQKEGAEQCLFIRGGGGGGVMHERQVSKTGSGNRGVWQ